MHLDRRQEKDLSAENGEPRRWAMETLCRLGDEAGSSRMLRAASAHVPAWDNPEGRPLLELASGALESRCSLNPACAATDGTELPPGFTGIRSCAPHLCGQRAAPGEIVAWGGRAACAFVNSAVGARSEPEGTASALAAAICGLTPERGLHLDENREPTVAVVLERGCGDLEGIGHALSKLLKGEVPVLCGVRPDMGAFKRLALAINRKGDMPLFHVRSGGPPGGLERIDANGLSCQEPEEPDLLLIGCPHLSEQEVNRWARAICDRPPGVEAWFFMSQLCSDKSPKTGEVLRRAGRVISDLCPLSLAEEMRGRRVGCSSPALAEMLSELGLCSFHMGEEAMLRALARL